MKNILVFFFVIASPALFAFVDLKEDLFARASVQQLSLTYSAARIKMFNEIDLKKDANGHYVTCVYCQTKYYLYKVNETPAQRMPPGEAMNTEHTWPQSKFNRKFSESIQKSDLHHLYPTFSKINAERGNLPMADVNAGPGLSCEASQGGEPTNAGSGRHFEPPQDHKGNVARSLFYFSIRYKIEIDPVQEYYLRQWHILDPVDSNERKRHEQIFKIQRNRNPFIDEPELVNQILDF